MYMYAHVVSLCIFSLPITVNMAELYIIWQLLVEWQSLKLPLVKYNSVQTCVLYISVGDLWW